LNNNDIRNWAEQTDTLAAQAINLIRQIKSETLGYIEPNHLPELENEELLRRLNADDANRFIAKPQWSGQCYETTSLSRQHQQPLIQSLSNDSQNNILHRWVARLIELAKIPQKLQQLSKMVIQEDFSGYNVQQNSIGISQIETARGRLIHRANIKDNLIEQYQILAPTEWNFHPKGILAQSLSKLNTKDKNEMSRISHLLINAIDPCVGYTLTINEC